ncbi:carbonic anhydrase 1-like [Ciona intestinalis]
MYITWVVGLACISYVHAIDCRGKNFVKIGNIEYRKFRNELSYDEADARCGAWGQYWGSGGGGGLVVIKNSVTQQCIASMVGSDDYVTSGRRIGGRWKWRDGSYVNNGYRKWTGQTTSGDCLQVSGGLGGGWESTGCENRNKYICQRAIPGRLTWGYDNNRHSDPPSLWWKQYPLCRGNQQSPIDIPPTMHAPCGGGRGVAGFQQTKDASWIIHNTGRSVIIFPAHGTTMWTTFKDGRPKLTVRYMALKWGSNAMMGSEHSIGGDCFAGEFQIFHHEVAGEIQALSFMIRERLHPDNGRWNSIFAKIPAVSKLWKSSLFTAPTNGITHLIGDTVRSGYTPNFILDLGINYHGSLTSPPCTQNVVWTIYPRTFQLSSRQMGQLRGIQMEGGLAMSGSIRPTQQYNPRLCLLR